MLYIIISTYNDISSNCQHSSIHCLWCLSSLSLPPRQLHLRQPYRLFYPPNTNPQHERIYYVEDNVTELHMPRLKSATCYFCPACKLTLLRTGVREKVSSALNLQRMKVMVEKRALSSGPQHPPSKTIETCLEASSTEQVQGVPHCPPSDIFLVLTR